MTKMQPDKSFQAPADLKRDIIIFLSYGILFLN